MSTRSKSKDIIVLLGAGASAEAGIPTSARMIHEIEGLLVKKKEWKSFQQLYNHVKSAIHYSAGLKGQFNSDVQYNIETLVNTLYELERNEEHPLYPFIASWNSRLVAIAENDFAQVRKFRILILRELKRWMCPEDTSSADYYRGFTSLQRDLNYPLRVFSLNYDLFVERLHSPEFHVESGFGDFGPKHVWAWERFDEGENTPTPMPHMYLYKLHGSINWKRDELTKDLFRVEQIETVEPERMELIFGRDFKLDAADPYLFYAYEFRRCALNARLIVVIGYGFGDAHINKMLTQSIRCDPARRIVTVMNCSEGECEKVVQQISHKLELTAKQAPQLLVQPGTASDFLTNVDLATALNEWIPKASEAPF